MDLGFRGAELPQEAHAAGWSSPSAFQGPESELSGLPQLPHAWGLFEIPLPVLSKASAQVFIFCLLISKGDTLVPHPVTSFLCDDGGWNMCEAGALPLSFEHQLFLNLKS